jgi:hypothetical protein
MKKPAKPAPIPKSSVKPTQGEATDVSATGCTVFIPCSSADVKRLRAGGFELVGRWVRLDDMRGATYKTIEALTMLDRKGSR